MFLISPHLPGEALQPQSASSHDLEGKEATKRERGESGHLVAKPLPRGFGGAGQTFKEDGLLHPEADHDSLLLSPGNASTKSSRMALVVPTVLNMRVF